MCVIYIKCFLLSRYGTIFDILLFYHMKGSHSKIKISCQLFNWPHHWIVNAINYSATSLCMNMECLTFFFPITKDNPNYFFFLCSFSADLNVTYILAWFREWTIILHSLWAMVFPYLSLFLRHWQLFFYMYFSNFASYIWNKVLLWFGRTIFSTCSTKAVKHSLSSKRTVTYIANLLF